MFTLFSIVYILVAATMIVLILLQRGEGADAGAGFGGGASGTVFGASGSASFLSRATAGLAGVFFVVSLVMAIYLSHQGLKKAQPGLGIMAGQTAQPAAGKATPAPVSALRATTSKTATPAPVKESPSAAVETKPKPKPKKTES